MAKFSDIVGQKSIKAHLTHALLNNSISHAYIFEGEEGCGKMLMAQAFSQALLCEKQAEDACGSCHSCIQAEHETHPDIIFVRREEDPNNKDRLRKTLGVQAVREQLVDDVIVKPYQSAFKVYIVTEAEKMTTEAQNAILKTLEEPPSYAVILLLVTRADALLPTIRSRCVTLSFAPLTEGEIESYLTDQRGISPSRARLEARFARGNLGQAIRKAEDENAQTQKKRMLDLIEKASAEGTHAILTGLRELLEEAEDPEETLQEFLVMVQYFIRDISLYKATGRTQHLILIDEISYIKSVAHKAEWKNLYILQDGLETTRQRISANVNKELSLEILLFTIAEAFQGTLRTT